MSLKAKFCYWCGEDSLGPQPHRGGEKRVCDNCRAGAVIRFCVGCGHKFRTVPEDPKFLDAKAYRCRRCWEAEEPTP